MNRIDGLISPNKLDNGWKQSAPNNLRNFKTENLSLFIIADGNAKTQTPKTLLKVSKGAKIRNQYNQVPHLTQDTNGKVTNSQLDTTKESQEVSPFPAGDHKAIFCYLSELNSPQGPEY